MQCSQSFPSPFVSHYSKRPINDYHLGVDTSKYEPEEKVLRCKLAALYRIVALMGWNDSIFNHISARVSPDKDHFLINPFGLLFDEITASSLVKVDEHGNVIDPGSTHFNINMAGYVIHSAIHMGRKDIVCAVHLHTSKATGIASTNVGYLPLSQASFISGLPGYHDYQGIAVDEAERKSIVEDIGKHNLLLLKNHGFLTAGQSVEEAFGRTYFFLSACEIQFSAMTAGKGDLNLLPNAILDKVQRIVKDNTTTKDREAEEVSITSFEAYVRRLDEMVIILNEVFYP